jgi:transcriptional regulator with XRE-family HTH domain
MDHDWPAIGRVILERRESLGLAQGAGGISSSTWRKIEKAIDPPYRRSTLVKIARALGWPDDAIDRLAAGRPPDELLVEPDGRSIEERVTALEAELAELWALVESSVVRHDPELLDQLSRREGRRPAGAGRQRAG